MSFLNNILSEDGITRNRDAALYVDGHKILQAYGRIDAPNPKISAQLKHRAESQRESIRAYSMPFYKNEEDIENLNLGLTASFDKIFDSYDMHAQSVPQAAMDAINFAAVDIVNFVEQTISGTEFIDYENIDITVSNLKNDNSKSFTISRKLTDIKDETQGQYVDEFTYTLQPEETNQSLEVRTETNDSISIKNIALFKITSEGYQDTFGINFESNQRNNYHSLSFDHDDIDTTYNNKIPLKTITAK